MTESSGFFPSTRILNRFIDVGRSLWQGNGVPGGWRAQVIGVSRDLTALVGQSIGAGVGASAGLVGTVAT